jgi:hypothetical protein
MMPRVVAHITACFSLGGEHRQADEGKDGKEETFHVFNLVNDSDRARGFLIQPFLDFFSRSSPLFWVRHGLKVVERCAALP